jgi:chromosome segregation ATPase
VQDIIGALSERIQSLENRDGQIARELEEARTTLRQRQELINTLIADVKSQSNEIIELRKMNAQIHKQHCIENEFLVNQEEEDSSEEDSRMSAAVQQIRNLMEVLDGSAELQVCESPVEDWNNDTESL